ncbi:MAG: flagellar hook-length control protein FliK [Methylacidiphilaceae bacterium]|nr:flagellar hook-length control protein FliK [Candidatus Methylacidiphilaceae bacterium]
MSNATAAGPSRGLLDLLFGSKGAEEAEAGGQGFGGLMSLINALKEKQDSEELGAEAGRTPREILPGKNGTDSSVAGMPGINATPDGETREKNERLARLSMLLGNPAAAAMMPAPDAKPANPVVPQAPLEPQAAPPEKLEALQPGQVNLALKQKALPPLNPQELKLLQEVNSRIEQANAAQAAGESQAPQDSLPVAEPRAAKNPEVVSPKDQPLPANLQKAMSQKGLDPRKLKVAEVSTGPVSGMPEKMLPTETYLRMHEGMKPPGKETAGKNQDMAETPSSQQRASDALTAGAITGTGRKELGLNAYGKRGELELAPEGAKQAKPDAAAFGAPAAAPLQTGTRDVFLPGPGKPEETRRALLGEVGMGVVSHALKGGGEMRLVIHPDDMGEVKLKVGTKNGKVEVQVTAENENVARLIRGGSRELEVALKDQNLSLAKFEVTVSDASSVASTVASTDTKMNLNEQFLSQNQSHNGAFSQGFSADDGRQARWGNDQGGRQGSSNGVLADDSGRGGAKAVQFVPKQAVRDGSRRLDVVA